MITPFICRRATLRLCILFGAGFLLHLAAKNAEAQVPYPPVYVHVYARSGSEMYITWQPFGGLPTDYEVFRDGVSVGTTANVYFIDSGMQAGTAHSYTITARNASGSSAPSGPQVGTTKTPDGSFVMDGWPDFDRYKIQPGGDCGCGDKADLGIWAAVRGRTLYVAMRTIPPGGQYDYFLMIDEGYDFSPAPWAKAGHVYVAPNQPFIGAESTNSFVAWFNAPASSKVVRSANPAGVIEGTLDLIDTFGYIPSHINIVSLAYETWDGGNLVAESPWGNNDNEVLANEIRSPLTEALRDEDQDGLWDRIDPAHGWAVSSIVQNADGTTTITAPAVSLPETSFSLQISNVGPGGPYYNYSGVFGSDYSPTISITDQTGPATARFYRVIVQDYD